MSDRSVLVVLIVSAILAPSLALMVPQGVAAYGSYNGNQEILVDPVRHLLYYFDYNTGYLVFVDTDTGVIVQLLSLESSESIDMSPDGSLLYAAMSTSSEITVVDLDTQSIDRTINLNFVPHSLRVGRADRLYVSDAAGDSVYVVDERNGHSLGSLTTSTGFAKVLEVDSSGDTLIAVDGMGGPAHLRKYSITTDTPQLLAQNLNATEALRQYAVDWAGGLIYVSYDDSNRTDILSLDDLRNLGNVTAPVGPVRSLFLSQDGEDVWMVAGGVWDTMLIKYNASDLSLVGSIALDWIYDWGALAPGETAVFVGRYDVTPTMVFVQPFVTPLYPLPDSTFACTPSHVVADISSSIPPLTVDDVQIVVDGTPLAVYEFIEGAFRGNITSFLDDGTHDVGVRTTWGGESTWTNWSFTVDRDSLIAEAPSLSPYVPLPDSSIDFYVEYIIANVSLGNPSIEPSSFSMTLDGVPLDAWFAYGTFLYAYVPWQVARGGHVIHAEMTWAGDVANVTWSFEFNGTEPAFISLSLPDGAVIDHADVCLGFSVDLGFPSVSPTDAGILIDGARVSTWYDYSLNDCYAYVEMDELVVLANGIHTWEGYLAYDGGNLTGSWSFTVESEGVDASLDLAMYEREDRFRMLIPYDWNLQEDVNTSGAVFDLVLLGPLFNGSQPSIIVGSEADPYLEETESYLHSQMNETMEDIGEAGVDYVFIEHQEVTINATRAMVECTILWDDYLAVQRITVFASEELGLIWFIIFTVDPALYAAFDSGFDEIVDSFEILTGTEDDEDDEDEDDEPGAIDDLLMYGIYAAVAAAFIIVALYAFRKTVTKGPPAGPAAQQAPVTPESAYGYAYCESCGRRMSLDSTHCEGCGVKLPSPPFGKNT